MYEVRIEKGPVAITRALERAILKRAAWLERFHPGLLRCGVTILGPQPHHRHGPYQFRLTLHVRGARIVAAGRPHPAVRTAMVSAFHVARRRLEDHLRRRRHFVKTHAASVSASPPGA